jgi:hypothetical protein
MVSSFKKKRVGGNAAPAGAFDLRRTTKGYTVAPCILYYKQIPRKFNGA